MKKFKITLRYPDGGIVIHKGDATSTVEALLWIKDYCNNVVGLNIRELKGK